MNRLQRPCGIVLAGLMLAVSGATTAQEKTEPAKTTTVPSSFRMYVVADGRFEADAKEKADPDKKDGGEKVNDIRSRVGKLHDPITEFGLNTVIAVFVRAVPKDKDDAPIPKDEADPVIKVLKFENKLAKDYRARRLGAFMAFVTLTKAFEDDDDRFARINEIDTMVKGAMVPYVQVGFAEALLETGKPPAQVTAWGLGADDRITIVLYHRFKIVKTLRFKADAGPTDKDLEELSDEVAALMGKKKASDK